MFERYYRLKGIRPHSLIYFGGAMRTISLEECNQVAGGDGESLSCPTGPLQPIVTVVIGGSDGVSGFLSTVTSFIGLGSATTPATIAFTGLRG